MERMEHAEAAPAPEAPKDLEEELASEDRASKAARFFGGECHTPTPHHTALGCGPFC